MITGLNHVTFGVRDLDQSFRFYTDVLGLRPVLTWAKGAYLLAGEFWIALILDEEQPRSSDRSYSHVAFSVDPSQFERLSDRIKTSSVGIWQENQSEGPSLYFVDPDGHKLELHASDLTARLQHIRLHATPDTHFFDNADAKAS